LNYTELVTLIQQTAESDEATFVTNIPYFVRRAEERIYRYIKLPKLRKVDTSLTTVQGVRAVTVPADFLAVDSLSVASGGVYTTLIPKEPDFIREAYGTVSYQSKPLVYSLRDDTTILLGPTPDATYNLELTYTYKPQSIVDATTNWLGTNAENALFCAAMCEALVFLKGEVSDIQYWEGRFKESVGITKTLAEGKDRTDEWRNSPPRAEQVTP
jgi:hypothetical protein